MKRTTRYVIGILVLLVVGFVLQLRIPQRFSWKETYAAGDRSPYGCYAFDSVMRGIMPDGYEVSGKTFFLLAEEKQPVNVVVVADELRMSKVDLASMKRLLQCGATVMLAYNKALDVADTLLYDAFGVGTETGWSPDVDTQKRWLASDTVPDGYVHNSPYTPILWKGRDGTFAPASYRVFHMLVNENMVLDDGVSPRDVLACAVAETYVNAPGKPYYKEEPRGRIHDIGDTVYYNVDGYYDYLKTAVPVVVRRRYGKGQVIFCATPRLLTNYGVLDPAATPYVHRLMTLLGGRRVVRLDGTYESQGASRNSQSPFRYFLSQPPLRSALYTLLAGLLVYMVFTARRRQRAIPVRRVPRNYMLDFVCHIGSLYYSRHTPADFLAKRYVAFADEMQRLLGVDITDTTATECACAVIALRTGEQTDDVQRLVRRLRHIAAGATDVTDREMRQLADTMDRLVRAAQM